jgi:hypothetical protein
MKALAATITLTVHIDIDDMNPDLALGIDLDPSFSFLASNRDIIAGWMRAAADQVSPSVPRSEGEQP